MGLPGHSLSARSACWCVVGACLVSVSSEAEEWGLVHSTDGEARTWSVPVPVHPPPLETHSGSGGRGKALSPLFPSWARPSSFHKGLPGTQHRRSPSSISPTSAVTPVNTRDALSEGSAAANMNEPPMLAGGQVCSSSSLPFSSCSCPVFP